MAQDTGVAGLLRSDRIYHRHLGLHDPTNPDDLVFAGRKRGAFSRYFQARHNLWEVLEKWGERPGLVRAY